MDYTELFTSWIGKDPIILKEGNHEELLTAMQHSLSFKDYPLMGELHQLLETRFLDVEEKHKRVADYEAHQLYAVVLHDLVVHTGVKRIVELGVLQGLSTSAFTRALMATGGDHLFSYDPNVANVNWWWMPAGYEKYTTIVGQRGEPAYHNFHQEVGPIDMLYIDTEHTYEDTVNFLHKYWINSVKPGSYVILDDCTVSFQVETDRSKIPADYWADAQGYGILRAVLEYIEEKKDMIDFAFIVNGVYSSGTGIIKLK